MSKNSIHGIPATVLEYLKYVEIIIMVELFIDILKFQTWGCDVVNSIA